MNIVENAKSFAIKAHMGQVRKNEKDKPMVMHPISVASILKKYGCDDNVIASGYLHDVVEDTKYTIDDIKTFFGNDIAQIDNSGSEEDKSLPWEKKKKIVIEKTKTLPLRNKYIICADKIDNLEDMVLKFEKTGVRDFSNFNRGEEQQKWYYTNIYNSLIYSEDENIDIFKRYKNLIDIAFYEKDNEYLKNMIFDDNIEYYYELKKLHAMKQELLKLKEISNITKSYVIEFSGTPRTGKTTTINNLYDFFKKGGFKVSIIEEFTTSNYYKNVFLPKCEGLTKEKINELIMNKSYVKLLTELKKDLDIILIDRSINDRQIWNYLNYLRGDMREDTYYKLRSKYSDKSKRLIDFLIMTYADPLISVKRDYLSSLSLEERRYINVENIEDFNICMHELKKLFSKSVKDFYMLNTSFYDMHDVSVDIASQIMPAIREKYIKTFKLNNNIK